ILPVTEQQAIMASLGGRRGSAGRAELIAAGREHHFHLGGEAVRPLGLARLPRLRLRQGSLDGGEVCDGIAGRRRHRKNAGVAVTAVISLVVVAAATAAAIEAAATVAEAAAVVVRLAKSAGKEEKQQP